MIKNIIREQMKHFNYSQADLATRTNYSPQFISEIISGKRKITPESSQRLGLVFGLQNLTLYNIQTKKDEQELLINDKGIEEVSNFLLSEHKDAKLLHPLTMRRKIREIIRANTLVERENDLKETVVGFRKFKDKPLAYFWIAMMEFNFGAKVSSGEFKVSYKDTVIKNVIKTFIKDIDVDQKIKEVTEILDKHGIVLSNGPFLKGSTINGAAYKRNKQRHIFMNDCKKRQYSYLFTLVHELIHIYNPKIKRERTIDNLAAQYILDVINKTKNSGNEFTYVINQYEKTPAHKRKDEFWNTIYQNTKLRIYFGDIANFIRI